MHLTPQDDLADLFGAASSAAFRNLVYREINMLRQSLLQTEPYLGETDDLATAAARFFIASVRTRARLRVLEELLQTLDRVVTEVQSTEN